VKFAPGRADARAGFRFQPQGAGKHRLTVRIDPRPEETFSNDNERTIGVEVVQEASKVLMIAGGPCYEYRFLKNLLKRDARVQLAGWLMSADADYPQEGDVSLKKLPATPKELFEYDVVILMDVDPTGLPPGFCELLEEFVGKHRGGLLYAAGDKYSSSFVDSTATLPIRNMLPVVIDAGVVRDELERGKYYEREWPLVPTPAALEHAATRLASQIDRNRDRWAEVAGFYWSFPIRKAKPGATALFVHPDPSLERDGEPRVLFATQFYEGGRTAWCGLDSTWRWRATAEEVYDKFWIQTIRYLTEGRLSGDHRRLIEVDSDTHDLGDTVRVSVLLQDENYRPVDTEETTVSIQAPDGSTSELKLPRDPLSPGWFRGSFVPRTMGSHTLRLSDGLARSVRVEPPALEFESPRLDEDALRELATLTQGSYVRIHEAAVVPDRIPDRRQTIVVTDEPIPLWDNWLSLSILTLLLAAEWILRKVNRLL
jgi:hypothetical protein